MKNFYYWKKDDEFIKTVIESLHKEEFELTEMEEKLADGMELGHTAISPSAFGITSPSSPGGYGLKKDLTKALSGVFGSNSKSTIESDDKFIHENDNDIDIGDIEEVYSKINGHNSVERNKTDLKSLTENDSSKDKTSTSLNFSNNLVENDSSDNNYGIVNDDNRNGDSKRDVSIEINNNDSSIKTNGCADVESDKNSRKNDTDMISKKAIDISNTTTATSIKAEDHASIKSTPMIATPSTLSAASTSTSVAAAVVAVPTNSMKPIIQPTTKAITSSTSSIATTVPASAPKSIPSPISQRPSMANFLENDAAKNAAVQRLQKRLSFTTPNESVTIASTRTTVTKTNNAKNTTTITRIQPRDASVSRRMSGTKLGLVGGHQNDDSGDRLQALNLYELDSDSDNSFVNEDFSDFSSDED